MIIKMKKELPKVMENNGGEKYFGFLFFLKRRSVVVVYKFFTYLKSSGIDKKKVYR